MFDVDDKTRFREEKCNIVKMLDTKAASVPYGSQVLNPLQSQAEFEAILHAKNWAITQTVQSNVLFFDLDHNDYNQKLNRFFNRRRDKYIEKSTLVNSKHGFLKVADANHEWCVEFARRYHNKMGIEIYAEKHWGIFAGIYVNNHNEDDPKRKTTWYPKDNLSKTLIEVTKEDLKYVFDQFDIVKTKNSFKRGPHVGDRNNACFMTACDVFDKRKLDFDSGLNFIKTWNSLSAHPLDDVELSRTVKSAWDKINNKELDFDNDEKIDNVASYLQEMYIFVTLKQSEEILLYNGKIYSNSEAETLIKEETEKLIPKCTTHDRNEVINKIKARTYTDITNFDSDPNLITILNGILNLETLELKPHTSEHLSRVLLPVEYVKPPTDDIEENLKDTLFMKFLKSSFTVKEKFRKDDFETVLEVIASPIVKHHVDERAFMFLGSGENGKSVCLGYIEGIMGTDNTTNITLQDIADDKFMRANLAGISLNIFTDLEQNELKHTGKIKAITSNEGIEVQKKNQQGFTLHPFCKLMFSCNRFPKVFDQSQGFFRRWIIVKWERNFEGDPERIEYLKEKLDASQEEKNMVFSNLVIIANKLNKTGKFTHSKGWKYIQKEWNENADPIDAFDSNYIIDSEHHKSKRQTYHFYKKVTLDNGESPKGMRQFSNAFAEYHEEDRIEIDGRTQRAWLNIDFKVPKQVSLEPFEEK